MALTLSPNMSLPIPSVGLEGGPQYAQDINDSLDLVDSHNHAAGAGVQIDPTGLNINTDLSIGENNLTAVRSLRLDENTVALAGADDLGCVYRVGDDLYYNDGLGNQIRMTQNAAVAGTPGSISNLVAPASASYVAATDKFVFQSNTNIAASLDMRSAIIRKDTALSAGITIAAPSALASDYTATLPVSPPASTSFMQMDSSGNIAASAAVVGGITLAMLVAAVQQSLNPAGAILAFGGDAGSCPTGYLVCDGSSVLRATYPALFAAIGTAYGTADGTHFNVPDFRGQFLRGVQGGRVTGGDPDTASRTTMNTGGNTANNVGSVQGFAQQAHTHPTVYAQNLQNVNAQSGGGVTLQGNGSPGGGTGASSATTSTETRPTNAYVNFIIKT